MSPKAYTDSIDSWETLESHAQAIFDKFTNVQTVAVLRASHTLSATASSTSDVPSTADPAGDMVYENALLFLQDVLITCEFTDSIKCGDSGQVLLVLKTWALSF